MDKESRVAHLGDVNSPLNPFSKSFDLALFRKTFVKQAATELPEIPDADTEYVVPADGVVILTATCVQQTNEDGLHIFSLSHDRDDNLREKGDIQDCFAERVDAVDRAGIRAFRG